MDLVHIFRRLPPARAAALSIFLCSAAACGSASQSVTAPGGVKCAVGASAASTTFGAGGGTGTVTVTANRECQWAASTTSPWIQLDGARDGQGDARIPFNVSANAETVSRRGAIVVGPAEVAIVQEPAACGFVVAPLAVTVSPAGERRAIDVTANGAACAWTARGEQDWLVVLEGAERQGSGRVLFEARPTAGPTRAGTLVVAGQTVTVTQGNGCSTSVSPLQHAIGASGGSAAISVAAAPGCAWSASSDVAWIAIASGASGAGPGTVTIAVSAWNGPTRTGTVRVDAHVVTVTQTAGCSFSIDPRERTAPAAGGAGAVSVSTAPGCTWTASSQAPWIAIRAGAGGSGAGQVTYDVLANSGPARTGAATIAGQTFTVRQDSGCSYAIDPAASDIAAAGGAGTVRVTAPGGCSWSAASRADWLTITGGASGSGPGTVAFQAAANPAAEARSGTLTIAGLTHTVAQAAAAASCTYAIDPASQPFGPEGGPGSTMVRTGDTCKWTVGEPSEDWVSAPDAGQTRTGAGPVSFTVAQNDGAERGATIAVAGHVFTIQQSACTFALSEPGRTIDASEQSGTFSFATAPTCDWNVTVNADWIRVTSAASGEGPATVGFSVEQNTGELRAATIAVGGQLFTVTQAAAAGGL